MSSCAIESCSKIAYGRGWCQMHLTRWQRHGDPLFVKKIIGDEEARFFAMVDKTATCWLWTGSINNNGYGQFSTPSSNYAHRWSYAQFVGPIPDGLHVDHLCDVRRCVNPAHLEAVTQAENNRRAVRVRLGVA